MFDFSSLVYSKCNGWEGALGGRPRIICEDYKKFFKDLKQSGADLVFFSDGQLQQSKLNGWCKKHDEDWNSIHNNISNRDEYLSNEWKYYQSHILSAALVQIIKKNNLGTIYTSTDVECDKAIVKYVHDKGAFAIISSDTDFLIFEQEYQFWYSKKLDLKNGTLTNINRTKLRKSMRNFAPDQMKILATVAGNDFTKHFLAKENKFYIDQKILDFCRKTNIAAIDTIHSKMISLKYDFKHFNGMEIIRESLNFYNITEVNSPQIADENFNFVKHVFKNGFYFQFDASFFDFQIRNQSDGKCLLTIFMEVFRKLGGIVLRDDQEKTLKIVTKWNSSEDYKLRDDFSPDFDIPENSSNSIWTNLLWCLGLDSDIAQYLDTALHNKRNIFVTFLSILFLRKV